MAHKFNANFFGQRRSMRRRARDAFLSHEQVHMVWQLFDAMDMAFVGIGTLENSAFIERQVLSAGDQCDLRRRGSSGRSATFFDADGCECDTEHRQRDQHRTGQAAPDSGRSITNGRTGPAVCARARC